ncbi:HK97 family phage prohead protease [Lelliottia sp.]|uniref:HK97 family phage prohead protease n=1 Tax=Lelliottia sp. TaxID=1898429 RepID=UPI00388F6E79
MNKDFEIRSAAVSVEENKLVGYVVPWNSRSQLIWGEFYEVFAPYVFKDSLATGSDVRALYEHDYRGLLGRGDISGMSFGFRATKEAWDFKQDPCVRTVTASELLEITFTATPAYTESDVENGCAARI